MVKRSLILCVLLLTGGIATEAGAQQKYRLRDVSAVGDVGESTSRFNMVMKITAAVAGTEMSLDFSTREDEKYVEEVLAVDGKGETTAYRRTYSSKTSSEVDPGGEQKRKVSSLQGKTVEVWLTGGKPVVKVTTGGKISKEDEDELKDEMSGGDFKVFPDRELAPGDEWEVDPKAVTAMFKGFNQGSIKCKFEDVVEFGGYKCARINVRINVSGKPSDSPLPMTMDLSGTVHHALELQRALSFDLKGPVTMKGDVSEGGTNIGLDGQGNADLKANVRWRKVGGKAVTGGSSAAR